MKLNNISRDSWITRWWSQRPNPQKLDFELNCTMADEYLVAYFLSLGRRTQPEVKEPTVRQFQLRFLIELNKTQSPDNELQTFVISFIENFLDKLNQQETGELVRNLLQVAEKWSTVNQKEVEC